MFFYTVYSDWQIISMAQVAGIVIRLDFDLWTNRGLNRSTVTLLNP